MEFLIWSIEHGAWWRPHERGYTRVLAEAGRYSHHRAEEIVRKANVVAFHECMIPVECVGEESGAGRQGSAGLPTRLAPDPPPDR